MSGISHAIQQIHGLKPSISHRFLINLENFVEKNDLKLYKEMVTLYKFPELNTIAEAFSKYGNYVSTPLGVYVEMENVLILLDISSDDTVGLYVHVEIFYNHNIDVIKDVESKLKNDLESFECKEVITRVLWQFKTKDYIDSVSLYEVNDTQIHNEAYPYLGESVDSYIDRFIASDETVLVMIGPAGTGKTKFIKYLMKYMSHKMSPQPGGRKAGIPSAEISYADESPVKKMFSVTYSTSQETYNDDEFFIDFVKSDSKLLILEDIDYNLRSRIDGNTFMHKLLNASDGIVELKNKKIIITTNLESEKKTDSALLRPGRTFDVLKTRYLNLEQATILANKLDIEFTIKKASDQYSLAEIYKNKAELSYKMSFT